MDVYKQNDKKSFMVVVDKKEDETIYTIYDEFTYGTCFELDLDKKKFNRVFNAHGLEYREEKFWSEVCTPFRRRLLKNLLMEKGIQFEASLFEAPPRQAGVDKLLELWNLKLEWYSKFRDGKETSNVENAMNIKLGGVSNLRL